MSEDIQEHIRKRYEIVKKIGSGAYGNVWKVIDKKTNQVFALKKIFDAFQHSTDAQRTYRQIMYLREFEHDNIIKLYQVFRAQNDRDIYLIFQFMQADLHNVIRENILQDIHKQYIVYQIALAIKYLHSGQVIHRDLKPSNILLNSECLVKICDFGLIRSIAKTDKNCPVLTQNVATRWYRAPQILLGSNDYTKQVDMWSLGCIIGEIILGKPMFPGNSTLNQLQKIISFTGKPTAQDLESIKSDLAKSMIDTIPQVKIKTIKQWFPYAQPQLVDLILKLLQFNPNKRLNCYQLLKHPYLIKFQGKCQEVIAKSPFQIENDQQKLTTKDYRNLIYETLKEQKSEQKNKTNLNKQKNSLKKPSSPMITVKQKPLEKQIQIQHKYQKPKSPVMFKPNGFSNYKYQKFYTQEKQTYDHGKDKKIFMRKNVSAKIQDQKNNFNNSYYKLNSSSSVTFKTSLSPTYIPSKIIYQPTINKPSSPMISTINNNNMKMDRRLHQDMFGTMNSQYNMINNQKPNYEQVNPSPPIKYITKTNFQSHYIVKRT